MVQMTYLLVGGAGEGAPAWPPAAAAGSARRVAGIGRHRAGTAGCRALRLCGRSLLFTFSPAAKPRFGALPCFEVFSFFFFMDSVPLGIADDQTENWNFVSVEQFKI